MIESCQTKIQYFELTRKNDNGGMKSNREGISLITKKGELRQRFEHDNQVRVKQQKPMMPLDENLLAAMQHGLPDCAGVALGLDRLLMLVMQQQSLSDVVTFDVERA